MIFDYKQRKSDTNPKRSVNKQDQELLEELIFAYLCHHDDTGGPRRVIRTALQLAMNGDFRDDIRRKMFFDQLHIQYPTIINELKNGRTIRAENMIGSALYYGGLVQHASSLSDSKFRYAMRRKRRTYT